MDSYKALGPCVQYWSFVLRWGKQIADPHVSSENAKVGDSDCVWSEGREAGGAENSGKHPRQDVNDSNLGSNEIKIQDSG